MQPTDKQKEEVSKTTNTEGKNEIISQTGMELTDETLNSVVGGAMPYLKKPQRMI